ncbi:unknown [Firmicutes bacterium CAG:460]|nr:unknown [Firmicutes bacterium CAG:460]
MKKKYAIFTVIIFILLVTTFTYFNTLKQNNIYKENIENNQTKITKGISMNLEQTAGAGDYKTVTQSGWPTEGYKFNAELSRCENGSTLSWDDTKKAVIVSGNLSDKCYVYFDIYQPTLAEYIKSQYTGTCRIIKM